MARSLLTLLTVLYLSLVSSSQIDDDQPGEFCISTLHFIHI